jgi:hypothetical protein
VGSRQAGSLLALARRGGSAQFYDPEGKRFGIPTFPYHFAPAGLLTRRQLRAQGLRPGGQNIQAQILWRHRKERRVAYLYDITQAKPKREPTPAQLAAIAKALAARKTCPSCGCRRSSASRARSASAGNAPTRPGAPIPRSTTTKPKRPEKPPKGTRT